MTRKDYILLAEALKQAHGIVGESLPRTIQWAHDCATVADALAAENPRFDRARFLKAAGVAP